MNGEAVQVLKVVARYQNVEHAADAAGLSVSSIRKAINLGTSAGGKFYLIAAKKVRASFVSKAKNVRIIRHDGQQFGSIMSAVRDFYIDGIPDDETIHREHMALTRAIDRRKQWHGSVYRRV